MSMELLELLKKTTSELDPVTERIMLNGFLVLFMLAGVGFLYWARWEKKKVEQMEQITAVCVEHVRYGNVGRRGRHTPTYICVFEYTYGEMTYTERDAFNVGTNTGLPEVGEKCTVRIDPAHPKKPYYLNQSSNRFTVLMGLGFIAMSIFGIIMYNIQF